MATSKKLTLELPRSLKIRSSRQSKLVACHVHGLTGSFYSSCENCRKSPAGKEFLKRRAIARRTDRLVNSRRNIAFLAMALLLFLSISPSALADDASYAPGVVSAADVSPEAFRKEMNNRIIGGLGSFNESPSNQLVFTEENCNGRLDMTTNFHGWSQLQQAEVSYAIFYQYQTSWDQPSSFGSSKDHQEVPGLCSAIVMIVYPY